MRTPGTDPQGRRRGFRSISKIKERFTKFDNFNGRFSNVPKDFLNFRDFFEPILEKI